MKRPSLQSRFETWRDASKTKFNNKYDYTRVVYTSSNTPVTISCPEHGLFETTPSNHLGKKHGCKRCAVDAMAQLQRQQSQTKFWSNITQIHGNNYTYDKTVIARITDYITVTCLKHGDFHITADHHLRGVGCAECARHKRTGGYTDTWFSYDSTRKTIPGILYLLKMSNATESFLKIGITKNTINHRYRGCQYKFETLLDLKLDLYDAFSIECRLKSISEGRYYPKLGEYKTESFSLEFEEQLKQLMLNELATITLRTP